MTAKENYDLLKLVVIRLGGKVYNGEEGNDGYALLCGFFGDLSGESKRGDLKEDIESFEINGIFFDKMRLKKESRNLMQTLLILPKRMDIL